MAIESIINLVITAICAFALGLYFNVREKRVKVLTENRFEDIKKQYLKHTSERKLKEKQEIAKLRAIAEELERKHHEILLEENTKTKKDYTREVEAVIKKAESRALQIEAEVKENAQRFLSEQQKEVQTKMVDLVIGVTKKVLKKGLSYDDHKNLIESALQEMEGEKPHGK